VSGYMFNATYNSGALLSIDITPIIIARSFAFGRAKRRTIAAFNSNNNNI